jgi:PAS domain S-box-containing protein
MRWCHYQEQLFGLVPGTFAGTFAAFLNCVHPDDRDSVQQVLTRVITIQQDYFDEFRVVWADASVHWILSKGRCFCNSAGKVVRVSGICLDITEHQQIQEQRHQLLHLEQVARAKAETANRMKDEFLSILSHEVRTPLNSVLGWIQILRSRSPSSNLTAQGIEALDRNAQAQAQILEDLLDMAQVIQGKLQLQLQSTNLNAVIGDAVDLIRPAARAKHIHIAAKAKQTHTGTSEFWGDPDRLRQVVWNLLSNAVKFTPPGGNITVTLIQSDIEAQIQVSDTGKGISAEFLPYVFDRFRQEDSTLTRSHGGLGLGLALVRYLVELHGGTVVAASEGLDRGATFTISLPLCSEP